MILLSILVLTAASVDIIQRFLDFLFDQIFLWPFLVEFSHLFSIGSDVFGH